MECSRKTSFLSVVTKEYTDASESYLGQYYIDIIQQEPWYDHLFQKHVQSLKELMHGLGYQGVFTLKKANQIQIEQSQNFNNYQNNRLSQQRKSSNNYTVNSLTFQGIKPQQQYSNAQQNAKEINSGSIAKSYYNQKNLTNIENDEFHYDKLWGYIYSFDTLEQLDEKINREEINLVFFHENIVKNFYFFENRDENLLYIFTELCLGGSVNNPVIIKQVQNDYDFLFDLLTQVINGIQHAHLVQKVFHGSLRLDYIYMTTIDTQQILFKIGHFNNTFITQNVSQCYIPPEMVYDRKNKKNHCPFYYDLYQLGVCMLLLCGMPEKKINKEMKQNEELYELMINQILSDYVRSPPLMYIIKRLLEYKPHERMPLSNISNFVSKITSNSKKKGAKSFDTKQFEDLVSTSDIREQHYQNPPADFNLHNLLEEKLILENYLHTKQSKVESKKRKIQEEMKKVLQKNQKFMRHMIEVHQIQNLEKIFLYKFNDYNFKWTNLFYHDQTIPHRYNKTEQQYVKELLDNYSDCNNNTNHTTAKEQVLNAHLQARESSKHKRHISNISNLSMDSQLEEFQRQLSYFQADKEESCKECLNFVESIGTELDDLDRERKSVLQEESNVETEYLYSDLVQNYNKKGKSKAFTEKKDKKVNLSEGTCSCCIF